MLLGIHSRSQLTVLLSEYSTQRFNEKYAIIHHLFHEPITQIQKYPNRLLLADSIRKLHKGSRRLTHLKK